MRRPPGVVVVRGLSRLLVIAYPAGFRREHGASFPLVAEDRWRRERATGAGSIRATLSTIRVLVADTWTGARMAHRGLHIRGPRRPFTFDSSIAQLRLSIRGLAHAPLVTLVATISLAIGIGANTAVFTAVDALLFAPAPGVRDMGRLVDICSTTDGRGCDTLGYPTYLDLRDHTRALAGVYAIRFEPRPMSLGVADGATLARTQQVSASFFDVLGARPALGRFFRTVDERQGTPLREAVLSSAFWLHEFGGDRTVVGRQIVLNGDPYVVVGVADDGFQGTSILNPDVWVPLTALGRGTPTASLLQSRESAWIILGARLAPGATVAQAQAETTAFARNLSAAFPDTYRRRGLAVSPMRRLPAGLDVVVPFLAVLMGLIGLVLLVTCANLGGLLLARAASRSREIAVRLALGASRRSLVAMCLIETVVLFVPGTALAFLVAHLVTARLEAMSTELPVAVAAHLAIDWRVAVSTALVALAMAMIASLAPAWQTTRGDLISDLTREGSSRRRQRTRRVFVATQVACCLVSIVMAALLLRALHRATTVDLGFQMAGIDVASVDFGVGAYTDANAAGAIEELRQRLAAIPGVTSVGVGAVVPLAGDALGFGDLRRAGDPASESLISAEESAISPEYLPTMHIPIVRGRDFTSEDRQGAPGVAIVNERLAQALWPGEDPVGKPLEQGDFRPRRAASIRRLTVVGVARDAKYEWAGEAPRQFIYQPLAQQVWMRPLFFLASPPGVETTLSASVRRTLKDFDRNLPLIDMAPLRQYADLGLAPARIAASLAGSLGGLALALATLGLYGLTAFMVSSRTREIGVRIALGADRARIVRLVVAQGLALSTVGGVIGLFFAMAATRLLSNLLFGVSPLDPVAFGAAIAAVVVVAAVATYVPAGRAATVSPVIALRVD